MRGREGIVVPKAPEGTPKGWLLTKRPFERSQQDYSSDELARIKQVYGSWDRAKFQLGFQEGDLHTWKENGFYVLEVGPGFGVSTQQLLERGVDIYALEPSLKFTDGDTPELEDRFSRPEFAGRISAAKAVDAAFAFPGKQFDVAFAIGPNFQTYTQTDVALIAQIAGVLNALSQTNHSFFTFEINKDGTVGYNSDFNQFDLERFLIDHHIRYTKVDFLGAALKDNAIRIFRMGEDGEDSATVFDRTVTEDLSNYSRSNLNHPH